MHTEREREHEKKEGEKTNVKNTREVCVCLENLTYFSRPQEYIAQLIFHILAILMFEQVLLLFFLEIETDEIFMFAHI